MEFLRSRCSSPSPNFSLMCSSPVWGIPEAEPFGVVTIGVVGRVKSSGTFLIFGSRASYGRRRGLPALNQLAGPVLNFCTGGSLTNCLRFLFVESSEIRTCIPG